VKREIIRGEGGKIISTRCMETVEDRFWSKVDKRGPNECWNWTGAINSSGYGSFRLDGKVGSSSRTSYSLEYGEIPVGLHVCHRCDNRPCVNPAHLFLGTNEDNHLDKIAKGRQARGESAGIANLKESDVRALRDAARSGQTVTNLSKQTGIAYCTVYSAVHGMTWKHIEGVVMPPIDLNDMRGQSQSMTTREFRDKAASVVELVARGMSVTIIRNGRPVAVLSPPDEIHTVEKITFERRMS
jgi:hypothetical protein